MSKTKNEMINELEGKKPTVSLNIFSLDTGEEGKGGMALHVDFGEDGPPKSLDDASIPQVIAALLSQRFSEIMEGMHGTEMSDGGEDEEVLSSLTVSPSKEKDEIDKQLEEMGIKPVSNNKEVH